DDYEGRYGLEKYYNDMLSRKEEMSFANFFVEIFSGLSSALSDKQNDAEAHITTTIEPTVQKFFEEQLAKTKNKWQADGIGGVIIDPKTGEIFSMASLPDFNPSEKQTELTNLMNPLVQSSYEMGSIIKPLTVAAGLDAGVITPETTYNDKGCITLNTKKICNYDLKARGVIPVQEVLNQSLNLGATFVEQKIGREKFRKYLLAYGLNEKTGIDLPGEISGDLRNFLSSSREVESATASFGQGIALTPIETARALCTLGNGGYLIEPHVVKKIDYLNKISREIKPKIIRQVLTKETSAKISKMLVTVVDTKLAGGKAKLENYSVAAKTGTAQMSNPNGGGYYEDRYLHSFFGYFPAYNPRFLIFMYMLYPKGVKYSSETLTEPFIGTTKFLINYYQVPPDR
ncbi:MAG: penicillin-binding protein 2, partial [Candidatus Vogelbacteria bacterium]|nr:penicillin-binding protein 2 [Candidatus Vogelbacteria bacterium]